MLHHLIIKKFPGGPCRVGGELPWQEKLISLLLRKGNHTPPSGIFDLLHL